MEVFVRNIPPQETQRSCKKFFSDLIHVIGIEDWTCFKLYNKPFVNLVFLTSSDGQLFLHSYGNSTPLFQGHVLRCSPNYRPLDKFALRSLEMKKKERENRQQKARPVHRATPSNGKTLICTSMSCGTWDQDMIEGSIYHAFYTSNDPARLTFKSKMIVYETTSQRLEIASQIIESVAWSDFKLKSKSALTLLLTECPRISLLTETSGALSTPLSSLLTQE
jgi:hypothetical protein